MGIKLEFNGDTNRICQGRGPEFTMAFLTSKINYWNDFKEAMGQPVQLTTVVEDLGYDLRTLHNADEIKRGYWSSNMEDIIDFGLVCDANREAMAGNSSEFVLNFNCQIDDSEEEKEEGKTDNRKRCYYWRVYKYHVDVAQITLRGWVDWCNELYEIQHNRSRPKTNRIFVSPDMQMAIVKARVWNKDRIERWLNDHGYRWTRTVETKYQYHFDNPDDVELVDSDAELKARRSA